MRGVIPRRENLQDSHSVLPVGNKSERAGRDHADLDVLHIVELAFSAKELIEFWRIRFFDVNNRNALLPCRNVSVGASDVNASRVLEGNERVCDRLGLGKIGSVQNFEAVTIHNQGVTELHGDAAGIVERRRADVGGDPRSERIIQVNDGERSIREHVSIRPYDGDAARACEHAARIESQSTFQEIVGRIAVEQRAYAGTLRFQIGVANDDQSFFFVGDVKETIEQMNGLLLVFRQLLSKWIDGECRGRSNGQSVFRRNVKALADGRNRRDRNLFRETFVINVSDVVDAKTATP